MSTMAPVEAVGVGTVADRVTAERSPNRTLTVTVLAERLFLRKRDATRSVSLCSTGMSASIDLISGRMALWALRDLALCVLSTGRGSWFRASALRWWAAPEPSIEIKAFEGVFAMSPIVSIPISLSLRFVTGPTPHK